MKRIAALFMVSSLVFQLGCGLDQCCQRKSGCSSYSKGSDGCAQKSCAQKGCQQKGKGDCGCAQKGNGDYGCAQKSCQQKGHSHVQKGSTQKGCNQGCEQKASQQKFGYDAPQPLELVTPTPTVPVIAEGLDYEGIVR